MALKFTYRKLFICVFCLQKIRYHETLSCHNSSYNDVLKLVTVRIKCMLFCIRPYNVKLLGKVCLAGTAMKTGVIQGLTRINKKKNSSQSNSEGFPHYKSNPIKLASHHYEHSPQPSTDFYFFLNTRPFIIIFVTLYLIFCQYLSNCNSNCNHGVV